jgi:ribosomal protein L11 methyltransferase
VDASHEIARFELAATAAGGASLAEREDRLVATLWSLGCEGSWSRDEAGALRLEAFFVRGATPSRAELRAAGATSGARLVEVVAAEQRDWAAEWRARATPIEVGERFLVDPREPERAEPAAPAGRFLLRLPARTAFGTGAHESTRLAVELLETVPLSGRSVLDVGAGSGILALAAQRLGAARVAACDLDPAAALLLPDAMRANGARLLAWTGGLEALADLPSAARFDLALVNVVPREIAGDLARLASALAPGAAAIFSGILAAQAEEALDRLARHGFVERARRTAGEWIAFRTVRTGAAA